MKKEKCGRSYPERTQVAFAVEEHAYVKDQKIFQENKWERAKQKIERKKKKTPNTETIGCAVSRVVYSI
jgi:hypothetical protein